MLGVKNMIALTGKALATEGKYTSKAKKHKEFHHLYDHLPYPLRLCVLNLPVPVQNLEDHFTFRFLEGTEADLLGHFRLFSDPH